MARILAKALNCLNADAPTTEPCLKCESCIAVNAGDDIDVIEIDGASNNRVDEIRELRENVIYHPARSRFKIYIIDEVHMLTTGAFNALLKTLEEPPSHVKFIFATTEPNKVLATIQSRCQRFDFRNINAEQIAGRLKFILKKEKIKYEDDLILPLAKMANGSMRDGLSLLDRLISTGVQPLIASLLEEYLGCPDTEKVQSLIERISDSDAAGTLEAIESLTSTGLAEVQIADALVEQMRDLMVIKAAGADSKLIILTDAQRQRAAELAEKFDVAALVYNIATLEKLRWSLKNSETARPLLEAALLRLALAEHFLNVDDLLKGAPPGSTPVKKNITQAEPPAAQPAHVPQINSLDAFQQNWQSLVSAIGSRLGNGAAGPLSAAQPAAFENDTLTVAFPSGCEVHKKICESNGRVEKIEDFLSKRCGRRITISLTIDTSQKPKTESQRQNEIINDPAVKTVLHGLDATITGIEEA
jgi:DNA polymerase-3 subunit gamma/tau